MKKILPILYLTLIFVQCKTAQPPVDTATATLENTYWKLAEMNGQPVITPADAREVHMILGPVETEKRIKGFAGCNTIGGSYSTEGSKIKFVTLSTKMFCQDTQEIENFFLKVLSQADSYKINGQTLELYQGSTLLAPFTAVYLK
jgi:heat shock protein HslJ